MDEYTFIRRVGHGAEGSVYLVRHKYVGEEEKREGRREHAWGPKSAFS